MQLNIETTKLKMTGFLLILDFCLITNLINLVG
jgi:hypothetical protein